MKKFGILFASALALLTLVSCDDEESENQFDDAYYASQAIIVSSDTAFSDNADGGTISFKAEGGSVVVRVSCGCDWLAENATPDLFTTSITSNSLTVTADQNTLETQLSGSVTLKTSNDGIVFATISIVQAAYGAPEITVETSEWNFPAAGALTTEIAVTSTADWTAVSADSWLSVTKTATGITLTATENGDTDERGTTVTLSCNDGISNISEYVTVTQDGKVYISLDKESISLGCVEGSATVTVDSNFDWDYSCDADWLTFSRNGDVLTVTASANESGFDREGTVSFTSGDGAANVTEKQLTVVQDGDPTSAMILTYNITKANTTTYLPLYENVDCTVDWGDGSEVETVTMTEDKPYQPSHTYAEAGEYDIIINGMVTMLYSSGISTTSDPLPITAVKQWGKTGLDDMRWAFENCTNLVSIASPDGAFADVWNFYYAFYNCSSLAEIPAGFFDNCTELTGVYMAFYGCDSLTELPKEGIFHNCPKINNLTGIIQNCHNIKEIPEGFFDECASATNLHQLFYGCTGLEKIPAGLFDKLTNVTDVQYVFYNCASLKEVPEGLFDSFTEVINFMSIFEGCSSLTTVPASLFSKNTKVDSFMRTFAYCTSLTGESPYDVIDGVKVHLYERDDYPAVYTPIRIAEGCFYPDTNIADYSDIPSDWKAYY